MPRKRLRTTNNRSYSVANLRQACEEVLTHGRTTRSVALQFKISRITLKSLRVCGRQWQNHKRKLVPRSNGRQRVDV
ncbi:unnamed protein product [Acanthoscelides obtectus]|nr:unnamed protein product [Acanthoscelides obtectus]CAK1650236.1 hypothetical protein AOBTE_LOCUS16707 [Acanthoscelides obtectus]